ncbi:MAG: IS110 family transposase [Chitinophagales bacterium]
MEKIFIGIDVSKASLDICIKNGQDLSFEKIDNTVQAVKRFVKQFKQEQDGIVLAMENTGRYNVHLYEVLEHLSWAVYVVNPLHIKKSIGLVRGKDDKTDAQRIAFFIEKNYKELPLWTADSQALRQLKVLQTERNTRVKMKSNLKQQQSDYRLMKSIGMDKKIMKLNKLLIAALDKQIIELEVQIEALIKQDEELQEQAQRIRTIPGVGKVLSWMMISKTNGFKRFNNPRKMACYAGVVPFDYQSGTSIRYKPKVSVFADKELKKILHMAAMSAIQIDNDLRTYYLRKVEEGKNKMSVINAIRNKIIHRIFALINNKTVYQKNLVLP